MKFMKSENKNNTDNSQISTPEKPK